MQLLQHIPSWLRNKYLVTGVLFAVWLLFFDDRDLVTTQFRHRRELNKLEESRHYYELQIEATRKELNALKSDPSALEKYAREKYWMKRDQEDLFILTPKALDKE